MADLAVQDLSVAGITPAYDAAAAGGDRFAPRTTNPTILHVKNGSAGAQTVTIDDPTSKSPTGAIAFNPDVAISVPAGGEKFIAVSPRFMDANGWVNLTYSAVTSLTLAIFRTT